MGDRIPPLLHAGPEEVVPSNHMDWQRKSSTGCESDDKDVTIPDFKWFVEIHSVMKRRDVVSPVQLVESALAAPRHTP